MASITTTNEAPSPTKTKNENGEAKEMDTDMNEQHVESFQSEYVDGDDQTSNNNSNSNSNGNSSATNSKKPARDNSMPPVKPKRPKSAYFIFMNEVRSSVREKFPTWGIGQIGKEMGRLWNELSDEKKAEYSAQRIPLQQQYEEDLEEYNNQLKLFEAAKFGPDGMMGPPRIVDILPTARVRKIMKLDKEVKGTSKEATLLVQWCTELFLGQLTDEAFSVCKKTKKKMIKYEDISATVRKNEQMLFLAQDFPPINRRSKVSKKRNSAVGAATEQEQNNTINNFFAPVAKSEISNVEAGESNNITATNNGNIEPKPSTDNSNVDSNNSNNNSSNNNQTA